MRKNINQHHIQLYGISGSILLFWSFYPLRSGWDCIWKHGIVYRNTYGHTKKKNEKLSFVKQASIGHQEEDIKVKNYFIWLGLEKQYCFIIHPCTGKHKRNMDHNRSKNGKRKKRLKLEETHLNLSVTHCKG
eukprot:48033_1